MGICDTYLLLFCFAELSLIDDFDAGNLADDAVIFHGVCSILFSICVQYWIVVVDIAALFQKVLIGVSSVANFAVDRIRGRSTG